VRAREDRYANVHAVLIIVGVTLVALALIAGVTLGVIRNNDQLQRSRLHCIDAGHSWVANQCVSGGYGGYGG